MKPNVSEKPAAKRNKRHPNEIPFKRLKKNMSISF
jgi:hypothetical protein